MTMFQTKFFRAFFLTAVLILGANISLSRADDAAASPAPAPDLVQTYGVKALSKLSKEDLGILYNGPIVENRYLFGSIVGSLFGFGSGHLIEGRDGAMYGFVEGGALALWIISGQGCVPDTYTGATCGANLGSRLGMAGFIGVKIWEIYDLFHGAKAQNRRYQELKKELDEGKNGKEDAMTFMILPVAQNSSGVTAALRFQF